MFINTHNKDDPELTKRAHEAYIDFLCKNQYIAPALSLEEFQLYKIGEYVNDIIVSAMNFGVEELIRQFEEYRKNEVP